MAFYGTRGLPPGPGKRHVIHYTAKFRERLSPQGCRPAPLTDVAGWQERVQRHTAEHIVDVLPCVQILDVPVPQAGEQLVDIIRLVDTQTPVEHVIEVPKISSPSRCSRSMLSAPQTAEQLVEVPTVMSFSSLQQSTAEQIIDIPVPRLRGVHPGPGSLLRSVKQIVDIPVPHGRGRVGGRSLQGLRPEQSSTAFAEQNVDSPVPRRGGSRGGLQGFSPPHSVL